MGRGVLTSGVPLYQEFKMVCKKSLVIIILCPQAIRKAPQNTALGFKQTAHKFAVVVQLLLGEIPDRATFREPVLKKPLMPYLQLTQGKGEEIQ